METLHNMVLSDGDEWPTNLTGIIYVNATVVQGRRVLEIWYAQKSPLEVA